MIQAIKLCMIDSICLFQCVFGLYEKIEWTDISEFLQQDCFLCTILHHKFNSQRHTLAARKKSASGMCRTPHVIKPSATPGKM